MPNLFPNGYNEEVVLAEDIAPDESETGYAPSLFFDGDILRDGQFRLVEASGVEAWEQWCKKCLSTERYGSPCYPSYLGIETEEARVAETREKAESIYTKQISEALLADPRGRTKYVESISFSWAAGDEVEIGVTVVGVDNATADFSVVIGGDNGGIRASRISKG